MKEYRFPIKPMAKSRPRLSGYKIHMPTKYIQFKKDVQTMATLMQFEKHPKKLFIRFYFQLPDSITKKEKERRLTEGYHDQKPDLDNLVGAVMDALYPKDDSKIAKISTEKLWSEDFEGFIIEVPE